MLAHVHTAQPTVTWSPGAGEICQLKAPGTGGLGHICRCWQSKKASLFLLANTTLPQLMVYTSYATVHVCSRSQPCGAKKLVYPDVFYVIYLALPPPYMWFKDHTLQCVINTYGTCEGGEGGDVGMRLVYQPRVLHSNFIFT